MCRARTCSFSGIPSGRCATLSVTSARLRAPRQYSCGVETGRLGYRETMRLCAVAETRRQPRYLALWLETGGFASPPRGGFTSCNADVYNSKTARKVSCYFAVCKTSAMSDTSGIHSSPDPDRFSVFAQRSDCWKASAVLRLRCSPRRNPGRDSRRSAMRCTMQSRTRSTMRSAIRRDAMHDAMRCAMRRNAIPDADAIPDRFVRVPGADLSKTGRADLPRAELAAILRYRENCNENVEVFARGSQ